jgi:hypothetical protein
MAYRKPPHDTDATILSALALIATGKIRLDARIESAFTDQGAYDIDVRRGTVTKITPLAPWIPRRKESP